jgi:hypothetical protein
MGSITHATSGTSGTKHKNASFRAACFTVYGDKDVPPADLDWSKLGKDFRFLAYGREICPTTNDVPNAFEPKVFDV